MVITYETVTLSPIPNTTVEACYLNGVLKLYNITPNNDYVLHDKASDLTDEDGNPIFSYDNGLCSCGANYDFSPTEMSVPDINGNMVTVTAYGSRQFFAFPRNLVPDPENNIYGGGDDHVTA